MLVVVFGNKAWRRVSEGSFRNERANPVGGRSGDEMKERTRGGAFTAEAMKALPHRASPNQQPKPREATRVTRGRRQ